MAKILRSLNETAEFLGKDRATVLRAVRRLKLPLEAGPKNAKLVEVDRLVTWKDDSAELTPSDRRNIAHATKLEAETAILKRKWIPIDDAAEITGKLCDIVQADIDQWDRTPQERTQIVNRLQETLARALEEWRPEG